MTTRYFGFSVADSMFPSDCVIKKQGISPEVIKDMAADLIPCLNPSHTATIAAMKARYGIDLPIPEKPPQVSLSLGDVLIVMSVRGLPRLTDRHEYSEEEINNASFAFSEYIVRE